MTIAGSDSGGGAGIQADLKSIAANGGYGVSVITALTAQNGLGVTGIHAPPAEFVAQQLTTVLDGFPVRAAKTGMLFSQAIINAVAEVLEARKDFPLVVDPVSVSQSGHRLLEESAVHALIRRILPLSDLVTPNRPEAEMLSDMRIESEDDVAEAARRILDLGPAAVLLKGGHMDAARHGDTMRDWLVLPGGDVRVLEHGHVATENLHGTGCTLSAAIATFLGAGEALDQAVRLAQEYLTACLAASYAPGEGAGPPDHMAAIRPLLIDE
ncbi:bifunctional hydroxymethylpyrimidine kinase/phosphomethylpyrimidine kinase [Oceanidesulfovibrio indonesiensis]|uniref:hydroxymethylpyrimidine kinase n=1 Tax=Oceanidesulfovibrio indonesiensis TaxID=54767 RepID=A0A7M3MIE9_9BACT|nr:bifunctional hydroxymethylpyrimidine kinase/phosphomethylpyrimidine kinase [Oceanidesulfovibrio indonesiensis]TVM18948.1 bifunctional hydroxymethylpyrimidine kinase/phosphomethylpyrimidine kinase [Oceanidesulfovibrio indonesiensis]